MGIPAWLESQLTLNTSDLPDQPILNSSGKPNTDLRPVQSAFFANAVTGQDQLRQRVAFALSQIWVVSAQSGVNNAYAYPPYWRIFRDNAFGNYRDEICGARGERGCADDAAFVRISTDCKIQGQR